MKKSTSTCLALSLAMGTLAYADLTSADGKFVSVHGNITADTTWVNSKTYILTKDIFVSNGAILTIEPGTVIRGVSAPFNAAIPGNTQAPYPWHSGLTDQPGALIVARGSKLVANGTPELPITFTCVDDPWVPGGAATIPASFRRATAAGLDSGVDQTVTPRDFTKVVSAGTTNANAYAYTRQWGGVVLLGRSRVASNNGAGSVTPADPGNNNAYDSNPNIDGKGTAYLEGLNAATFNPSPYGGGGRTVANSVVAEGNFPGAIGDTTQPANIGVFGGNADSDNSGWLRFCSHRYGGYNIAANNELNGVTLAACGSNTVLEWQEVFNCFDDSFEWFGGYPTCRYLFSFGCCDDNFDWDLSFQGKGQFWFGIDGVYDVANVGRTPAPSIYTDRGDKLMECDGPEPDNVLTDTFFSKPTLYNITLVGSKGNGGASGRGLGIELRRSTGIIMRNVVIENILGAGVPTLKINGTPATSAARINSAANPNGDLDITNVRYFNTDGAFVGVPAGSSSAANTPSPATNVYPALTTYATMAAGLTEGADDNSVPAASQLAGIAWAGSGLDIRLAAAAAGRTGGFAVPTSNGFAGNTFFGAAKDNNLVSEWTMVGQKNLGLAVAGNTARPVVAIGRSGTNPTVSFTTVNTVGYTIERSTDKKTYTPINVQTGTGALVTYTDTTTNFAAGTPVFYRVIPQ